MSRKSSSSADQLGGSPGKAEDQVPPMRTVSSRMRNLMRDELLINVRKFETQVCTTHTVCMQ